MLFVAELPPIMLSPGQSQSKCLTNEKPAALCNVMLITKRFSRKLHCRPKLQRKI